MSYKSIIIISQLGTPNELTDDKGEVVWLADYEAWGNTAKVIYSETKLTKLKVAKEHLQPIRFQGQHYDTETGWHYNRFRYYDPDMGMFTSRDPIGLMGGDNVFAYAPNPTGWVDPLGLAPYGLGGGPYSQSNALGKMNMSKDAAKALSKWHFEGRDARNGPHPTYAQVTAKNSKWRLLSPGESIFHDNGVGKPEKKFIHPDGREAVFDGDCLCAVTDPKYKPTYNYVNPGKKPRGWYDVKGWNDYVHRGIGHGVTDVLPYFIGGNDRGED